MSKERVVRALEAIRVRQKVEGYSDTVVTYSIAGKLGEQYRCGNLQQTLYDLIRAVDEQYPEGYDEQEGLNYHFMSDGSTRCPECYANPFTRKHNPDCHRWHTRVALLALCRDITGEKG